MGDHEMMPHHGTAVSSSLTSAWNATGSMRRHRKMMVHNTLMHNTFFWGHKTEVLFQGWPGSSTGMYAVALTFVFALAVLVEWFNHHFSAIKPGTNKAAAGFFQTGMYAVRSGLSYMVMLAVMSFNGGIFLAAVGGHAVGFTLFGSRGKKSDGS
ncbi:hypothetical protein OIU76_010056 [Salix suchowensis]|uniref:Copper transport protein n=2 Tax=Salix TaxID=40685 RepID=A0A9Q0VEG1_9ROSI|nr:hypothetical protein OIU76_010056 [Salix suchowensis]KAJ6381405.1 hypothetical protein OIU77_030144 [Salix suchowensis]KAJ6747017.1 SOLUTE CARRIER FAMILY 31 COPPER TRANSPORTERS [Salix koriyanagi]